MTTKKKTAKKTAANANPNAALPNAEAVPEGFEKIGGGYAPTWKCTEQPVLQGAVTGAVREVEMTIGRKKQVRRCMEVTHDETGESYTVWESAALGALFDTIQESGEGPAVFVRYDGLGTAKKGQNPPKLFTVAIQQ